MTEPFDPTTGPGSSESPHDRPAVDPGGAFQPPTPPSGYPPVAYPPPAPAKPRGGILTRLIAGLLTTLLIFSIVLNFYLGGIVFRMIAGPTESVYLEGDHDQRIVILPVRGAIGKEQAAFVRDALMVLKKKPPVAVILRVDSPGGGSLPPTASLTCSKRSGLIPASRLLPASGRSLPAADITLPPGPTTLLPSPQRLPAASV